MQTALIFIFLSLLRVQYLQKLIHFSIDKLIEEFRIGTVEFRLLAIGSLDLGAFPLDLFPDGGGRGAVQQVGANLLLFRRVVDPERLEKPAQLRLLLRGELLLIAELLPRLGQE